MRPGRVPPVRWLVVLDFDGTIAVGDAPVRAYLEAVSRHLPTSAAERAADLLDAELIGAGRAGNEYALVAAIAAEAGVPEEHRRRAYASSRDALHTGTLEVTAPSGLGAALARRPADVGAVVVTNAPADGLEFVLERLEVAVDEVIGDAGKPSGMSEVLRRLSGSWGVPLDRVLSVGDLWTNDLAPAAALGAATAHVDRYGRGDGSPTFRARTLEALLPDIERWWAS